MRTLYLVDNLCHRFFSSSTPHFRVRACAKTFSKLRANLNATVCFTVYKSLSVGISNNKINTLKTCCNHIIYSVTTCSTDTNDGNARFKFPFWRNSQLDTHDFLLSFEHPLGVEIAQSGPSVIYTVRSMT